MVKKSDRILDSDVLVIGGAGAAVMSALSASRAGAQVTVVSKGKIGKSGNTIMIGGGFSLDGPSAHDVCGYEEANLSFTKEQLFDKLVTSSFYIGNQRIAKQYVEQGPYAVRECLEWAKQAGQKLFFIPAGNSWMSCGRSFGVTVRQGIKDAPGISVYEDTTISHLLLSSDTVVGAVGVNIYTGEVIQYNARAVVIATGGYQPFSLKNSISDMTGDGIALALRAGASVVDMEFFLYLPTITEPGFARGSILPYLFTMPNFGALEPKVTDLDGVELPISADCATLPRTNKVNKIVYSYFWGKGVFEKYAQYGNQFYYDYSAYSGQDIYDMFERVSKAVSLWHAKGLYNGVSLTKLAEHIVNNGKRLKVGLGNEYSMGGISVTEDFSTGVKGLYAAGEVTGGSFGAFRSGDGLVEMLAHGLTAGENAARYSAGAQQLAPDNLGEVLADLFAPLETSEGISPSHIHQLIERASDEGFNFFRSEDRLQAALAEIKRISGLLGSLHTKTSDRKYNLEWYDSITAKSLALCVEIGVTAALNRKESRGCHMRADYPAIDNENHLYNTYARLNKGDIVYWTKEPDAVYAPLDRANYASIPEYIFSKYGGKAIENFNIKKP